MIHQNAKKINRKNKSSPHNTSKKSAKRSRNTPPLHHEGILCPSPIILSTTDAEYGKMARHNNTITYRVKKSRHSLHPPAAYLIHIGYKTQQNGGVGITQFPMQ